MFHLITTTANGVTDTTEIEHGYSDHNITTGKVCCVSVK